MNITIEFFIFEQIWRTQCIKFKLKLTIFIFCTKLALKGCFQPKRKGFNHQITLKVTLKKYKPNGEIEFRPVYFNSATKTVINHKFSLDKSFQEILFGIDNWINEGSGWIVELIEFQYINVSTYRPLSGSSYVKLPAELEVQKKD